MVECLKCVKSEDLLVIPSFEQLAKFYKRKYEDKLVGWQENWINNILLPTGYSLNNILFKVVKDKLLLIISYYEKEKVGKVAYEFDEWGMRYILGFENRNNGFKVFKLNEKLFQKTVEEWKSKDKWTWIFSKDNSSFKFI